MAALAVALTGLVSLVGCGAGRARGELDSPAFFGHSLRVALASGELERAIETAERGLARFPKNGTLLAWNALLAQMRWQDDRTLALLHESRNAADFGGIEHSELLGRIGEMLFRTGAYADSVPYLNAGTAANSHEQRRKALVKLSRDLPYSRVQPRELAAELPLLDGPLPELLCSVGGRQRPFVLDTGASFTTVTRALATELGVSPILEAGDARDGTGSTLRVAFGVMHAFVLGAVDLDALPVLVVDDDALALRDAFGGPDRAPTAVVGLDILARFRVTFDPARRSVLFELPRPLELPQTVETLRHDGRCLVPVRIEGRRLWFVLDTGASHSSLTEQGLESLPGDAQRARTSFRRVRTPGGASVSVREVPNLAIEVSGVRFESVELAVIPRRESRLFPVHGVLGADLLMRCRTTFDGGRLRIVSL